MGSVSHWFCRPMSWEHWFFNLCKDFILCDIRVWMASWLYGGFAPLFEFTSRYFSSLWVKRYQRNIAPCCYISLSCLKLLFIAFRKRDLKFWRKSRQSIIWFWKQWINNRADFDVWSKKWTLGNSRFIPDEKWFQKYECYDFGLVF